MNSIAFSLGGETPISGGGDGTAWLWGWQELKKKNDDVSSDEPIKGSFFGFRAEMVKARLLVYNRAK